MRARNLFLFTFTSFCQVMDTGIWGANNEDALEGLKKELKEYYNSHPELHRTQGELTLPRIKTSGDWPKLKSKAASTRHIVKFAEKLAFEHNSGTFHDRRRLAVCKLLNRFYDITSMEGRYVSEECKDELKKLGRSFIEIYEKISREALVSQLRRWKWCPNFTCFNIYVNCKFRCTGMQSGIGFTLTKICNALPGRWLFHCILRQ